jgi:very-short-patch-repair endonuclease
MNAPSSIKSQLELAFWHLWEEKRPWLPAPVPQHRFVAAEVGGPGTGIRARLLAESVRQNLLLPLKDYRADFAWPDLRAAVEIDGLGKGHQAYTGWMRDIHKGNLYTYYGWTFLRFTRMDVHGGSLRQAEMLWRVTRMLEQAGCDITRPTSNVVDTVNTILDKEKSNAN